MTDVACSIANMLLSLLVTTRGNLSLSIYYERLLILRDLSLEAVPFMDSIFNLKSSILWLML